MKLCFTDHGTAKIRSDLSKFFPPELRPGCSQDIKSAAKQLLLKCDQKEYQSLLDVSKLLILLSMVFISIKQLRFPKDSYSQTHCQGTDSRHNVDFRVLHCLITE